MLSKNEFLAKNANKYRGLSRAEKDERYRSYRESAMGQAANPRSVGTGRMSGNFSAVPSHTSKSGGPAAHLGKTMAEMHEQTVAGFKSAYSPQTEPWAPLPYNLEEGVGGYEFETTFSAEPHQDANALGSFMVVMNHNPDRAILNTWTDVGAVGSGSNGLNNVPVISSPENPAYALGCAGTGSNTEQDDLTTVWLPAVPQTTDNNVPTFKKQMVKFRPNAMWCELSYTGKRVDAKGEIAVVSFAALRRFLNASPNIHGSIVLDWDTMLTFEGVKVFSVNELVNSAVTQNGHPVDPGCFEWRETRASVSKPGGATSQDRIGFSCEMGPHGAVQDAARNNNAFSVDSSYNPGNIYCSGAPGNFSDPVIPWNETHTSCVLDSLFETSFQQIVVFGRGIDSSDGEFRMTCHWRLDSKRSQISSGPTQIFTKRKLSSNVDKDHFLNAGAASPQTSLTEGGKTTFLDDVSNGIETAGKVFKTVESIASKVLPILAMV